MSLESPKISGLTNINYVVMSVLNRLGDYSMRHYSRLQQIIIECYINLNIWHLQNIEVVYLRMSEALTVDLPDDFIDYTKIGVPINGKLRVLTKHDKILLPRTFEDGEEVGNVGSTTSDVESAALFFIPHFRSGEFVGGLYGLPGGIDQAYYRIDWERRTIVFSGTVTQSEIVLEYISTGIKLNGSTVIPRETVPVLQAYADWWHVENNSKVPMNTKAWKKDLYEEQLEALRSFNSSFTADEYKRLIYKYARQTPKR